MDYELDSWSRSLGAAREIIIVIVGAGQGKYKMASCSPPVSMSLFTQEINLLSVSIMFLLKIATAAGLVAIAASQVVNQTSCNGKNYTYQ